MSSNNDRERPLRLVSRLRELAEVLAAEHEPHFSLVLEIRHERTGENPQVGNLPKEQDRMNIEQHDSSSTLRSEIICRLLRSVL